MTHEVTADLRFSITPEWVLDSDISDRAVRVYGILARYADSETLQAFPSRETLAQRARCHAKSVTRAIDELVAIGAVIKQHRRNGDAYQSNLYTLRRVGPPVSPGTDTRVTRVGTPMSPGRDTHVPLTITTELEPKELYIKADISESSNRQNIQDDFERFWNIYPKKDDKPVAYRSFLKVLKTTPLEDIIAGAEKYRDDPNREDQYTKNGSTWLRAEAWNNGPLPARKGKQTTLSDEEWEAYKREKGLE
jgi:hypothetical protein